MDLFKTLLELNNTIELEKLSKEKYESDSDDEEGEKEFLETTRQNFIHKYNKRNNRQFKISKFKD